MPSSRFFLRATCTGLSLFAFIYGLHVAVTGEIFPSWDDTTVTLSCVTLALLFTVYRAALWQLPLFLFALSAVGIRFLADPSPLPALSIIASPSPPLPGGFLPTSPLPRTLHGGKPITC